MKPKNKTVLILEDEKPLFELIKSKFETEGFNAVTAKSVAQALQCLKSGVKIDVIWLDHYLYGKKDGIDFVTQIKKPRSVWKNLPIFLISNTVSAEKVKAYLKLGINKYYPKTESQLGKIITDIKKFLK